MASAKPLQDAWGAARLLPTVDLFEEGVEEGSDTEAAADLASLVELAERPDLALCPATPEGLGAVVRSCKGPAAEAGLCPGTMILSVNEQAMDTVPVGAVEEHLKHDPLPLTVGVKPPLNLPPAKKMKKHGRDPVTICTARCRSSGTIVQVAIGQLGWKELTFEAKDASVVWLEHGDPSEGLAPVQTVTRLDAFLHMCRKAPFARCMRAWQKELPDAFAFVPPTWVLPMDAADLELEMGQSRATYIAKPSTGTQGKGIVLAKKWSDLTEVVQKSKPFSETCFSPEYVVQRYVSSPLLLDGLKFDMRIYVVVTSIVPLRGYLFKEGLARFCTVPYQAPKESNLKEACMHLTNFAVNKQSKDFQATSDTQEGSKRSVSSVFWQIEASGAKGAEQLWADVAQLAAKTLAALRPSLLEYYVQRAKPLHPWAPKGVQILGLDILLDSSLAPHLLELNANPSLSVLQPADPKDRDEVETPAGSGASAVRRMREEEPEDTLRKGKGRTTTPGRDKERPPRSSPERRCASRGASSKSLSSSPERRMVQNPLDVAIKKELVAQALLLARPALQSKVQRLRKQWLEETPSIPDPVPLDDEGAWAKADLAEELQTEVRQDAPSRSPGLVALDLAAAPAADFAAQHLALYRAFARSCGPSQAVGQGQVLKLLERGGFIGEEAVFKDKIVCQLWLTKIWRLVVENSYGLGFAEFLRVLGLVGDLADSEPGAEIPAEQGYSIGGIMRYMEIAGD
ncbi:unnamed protein product [Effrenium voratum]|nr:unnamed protein product [Effrenium voratum]